MHDQLTVGPDLAARYQALQLLIRPEEVAILFSNARARSEPRGDEVAHFIQGCLRDGRLRYIKDPLFRDIWSAPSRTLQRKGGDCEDLSILATSIFERAGTRAQVGLGRLHTSSGWGGHAWVEGADENGPFLLEATSGELHRAWRPDDYQIDALIGKGTIVTGPDLVPALPLATRMGARPTSPSSKAKTMKINIAHLNIQRINCIIFEADARVPTNEARSAVLNDLTLRARSAGLAVEKRALAFRQGGHLMFQGDRDLVQYLCNGGSVGLRWTHTLDV